MVRIEKKNQYYKGEMYDIQLLMTIPDHIIIIFKYAEIICMKNRYAVV